MNASRPIQCAVRFKSIVCFMPIGRAQGVMERLRKELGVVSVYANHARGTGLSTKRDGARPEYVECEVVTVLTTAERADEIFSFVFRAAGIDRPHAGMVLMSDASCAELLTLPGNIPDEA